MFWSNERKHSFNVPRVVECLDMMGVLVKFIFISVTLQNSPTIDLTGFYMPWAFNVSADL